MNEHSKSPAPAPAPSTATETATTPLATSAFVQTKSSRIDSLNVQYEEYQHQSTKAKHIHLAAENKENVFMVALRTVPTDSTGVAHILEHTSLCGSKRYPVRDPFFMMIRRSLNTFMNAFTSADWTAYPFASQNKKDFNNLLDVYLDAVFFARLDPLDFAQEGHRIEFEEAGNPNSDLVYKGVVFNEMKGAMSSISSQLWQAVGESLFPDTTYGVNSGGDPASITDLSYEQLQTFYQTHYHPDNAVFITFGDIPAAEHQVKFERLALSQFQALDSTISVPLQQRFKHAKTVHKAYPLNDQEAQGDKTHLLMAWILTDIKDPYELMSCHLLSNVLLENSASPLQYALETTELGSAPSPLCGVDDSGLEMVFVCGLEGSTDDKRDEFEALILSTLQSVADKGIEESRLIALLDQLELQQREISGDSYPYGLQLMLSCLATAMHRGEADAALNIDPILKQLREDIQKPEFVKNLVNKLLLNNEHRITLVMSPDTKLSEAMAAEEKAKLEAIQSQLTEEQKAKIVSTSQALEQRQLEEDDPELLPKVELTDIPADIEVPDFRSINIGSRLLSFYPQGTNGISYQQIVTELPLLSEQQQLLLPLHNRCLTEFGIGDKDYLEVQNWQSDVCGGISSYSAMRGELNNEQNVSGYFTVSAKGLNTHSSAISELLQKSYQHVRFDEHQRLRELVAQSRARSEQSVTGNGHSLAMTAACQGFSPTARFSHISGGVEGIRRIKALDDSLNPTDPFKNNVELENLASTLSSIHKDITNNSQQFLFVGEEGQIAEHEKTLQSLWQQSEPLAKSASRFSLPPCRETTREIWLCNTQVNFCAKAYPTVPAGHVDAPALSVLGGVLRNGFLHTAIREQGGAYGGGASQDSSIAGFRFYSYRDPRLSDTLDDFDKSIEWLISTDHPWRVVEEAILGVISSLDKPSSPAGTAKQHFHNQLFGRTTDHHIAFRNAVLNVTQADLKRVTEQYLRPEIASMAIITHQGEEPQYQALLDIEGMRLQIL